MIMVLLIICLILTGAYLLLLCLYRIGWHLQPAFILPQSFTPQTRLSIIIPARNEAANIEACIRSILAQDYPIHLFEIIVIDDFSEDETAALVLGLKSPNVRLLSLSDYVADRQSVLAFKKKALGIGIEASSGELIITTDADCIAPPQWLLYIAALYQQTQAKFIVAPVDFTSDNSLLQVFQSIDFMTMQGITAAAHRLQLGNMANGANLAFSKEAYVAVDGYNGIDHLASGDDYLLMVKIQDRFPGGIHYLKSQNAIVKTAPQTTWHSFLQQRIRWASKTGKYKDHRLTAILLLVYLYNASFLFLVIAGFFEPFFWEVAGLSLLLKIIGELLFLMPVAGFFHKKNQLFSFPLLQPIHIGYIILAGFLQRIGKYEWKGRQVK